MHEKRWRNASVRWLLPALLAAGCGGAADGPTRHRVATPESSGNDEVMRDDVPAQSGTALTVTLSSDPELTLGERDDVDIHVLIRNDGAEEVLAASLAAQLRVDDRAPLSLSLGEHGITRLAPGETIEFDENLGVRLIEAPGDHTLQLDIGSHHSLPIHILVRE